MPISSLIFIKNKNSIDLILGSTLGYFMGFQDVIRNKLTLNKVFNND